jgi:hypothetical protein
MTGFLPYSASLPLARSFAFCGASSAQHFYQQYSADLIHISAND